MKNRLMAQLQVLLNQSNNYVTPSDNPTSTSSPQSPDNPVPIEPIIDPSTQQSDTSLCVVRERPKQNCRPPTYLKDYVT